MKKYRDMTQRFTAPQIDSWLQQAQATPELIHVACIPWLDKLITSIQKIKVQGDDDFRQCWLVAPRGSIIDFGDYDDFKDSGEVDNPKEFNQLWQAYYPDKVKWYQLGTASYQNTLYVYVDKKLTFQINANHEYATQAIDLHQLIDFLAAGANAIVDQLQTNAKNYYSFLERELPFSKRFGKIKRLDFWQLFPESKESITANITQDNFAELDEIVRISTNPDSMSYLETMTAADFFNYCSIGYNAIESLRGKIKQLKPIEQYALLADGRDCGLKAIDQNDANAFEIWFNTKSHCGGHPWEILRGGNSTHISLYVTQIKGLGWRLRLAGDSWIRVNETVHIALALHKNRIPFVLQNASGIYNMVTGSDYIGIVPDLIMPRYCHSHFPKEDQISDFMNLGFEDTERITEGAQWYPLDKIELA